MWKCIILWCAHPSHCTLILLNYKFDLKVPTRTEEEPKKPKRRFSYTHILHKTKNWETELTQSVIRNQIQLYNKVL